MVDAITNRIVFRYVRRAGFDVARCIGLRIRSCTNVLKVAFADVKRGVLEKLRNDISYHNY
jgi:hypothetical protein